MNKVNHVSLANPQYISRFKDIDDEVFLSYIKAINKEVVKLLGKKDISIIFVRNEYIKRLNKDFRSKDEVTDVLSFSIDETNNEVYISPGYIYQSFRRGIFVEELLRTIIHGILHIYGYDHEGKFYEETKQKEKMFKVQEDILNRIIKRN